MQCTDLKLNKSVDNDSPNEGDTVIYTVTVSNNGPDTATNVEITDMLPSRVTYASATVTRGNYDSGTGLWNVGSMSNGANATLTITATVDTIMACGVPIINTASITAMDQADPDTNNNSDSVDIAVKCTDLKLSKSVDSDSPNEGDSVIYTVIVTNDGPDKATNVEVTDVLPSEVTYASARATQGRFSYVSRDNKVIWTVGSLTNGTNAKLTITVTVNESACGVPIINTASITAVDQADPDASNNNASVDIAVKCVDLEINKSVDNSSPNEGDTIIYTVAVTNNGPDNATNIQISDVLPPGITHISDNAGGRYNNITGMWFVRSLSNGDSRILTITAKVDTGTVNEDTIDVPITNTASVIAVDQADPNSDNNSSSASLTIARVKADLAVSAEVNNEAPNEGDSITYTIAVTNTGPDNATNVEITDQLPSGVIYVSDSANGNYNSDTGVWIVGELNSGANANLTITATVDENTCAETIANTASITAMDQANPDNSNNSDSADITVQCADLSVIAAVDNSTPNEGDTIVYTVTATNSGPDTATNVEITNILPSEVIYVSDDANGSYESNTGVWTVGDLNSFADDTLAITLTVSTGTSGITITNSVNVTAADQADPNLANNSSSASLTSVRLELISASYAVMKSLLTLVFNDPVDPEQTRFDRIGIEIADTISPDFSLSGNWYGCPGVVSGTPYEDNGVMLYPVTIDVQCDVLSTMGLVVPAFVTHPADDIDLLLESGAFVHPDGGQSPAAGVHLSMTVDGFDLRTKGDVNGDGKVTAYDAQLILQCAVYGETVLPIYDTVLELVNWGGVLWEGDKKADVIGYLANTDNRPGITANDAAMVLRFSAGLTDSFCESCAPVANLTRRNGSIVGSSYSNRKLEVSINLDDVRDVYSADMVVTYDPQALTLTDVSGAAAISDWLSAHGTTAPGKLRISLAGASQPTADGSLVTISFDAASADAIGKLDLTEFRLNGGRLRTTIQNLPKAFALLQNYPNPFNPETWIPYRLSEPADVTVTIYNVTGQIVRRLELGNMMPGSYAEKSRAAYWDGKNEAGERVSSGTYFYHLQAGQDASVRKMVIAE